jgi:hypothetical protein
VAFYSPASALMPRIYFSYRREDSPGHAGRLYDRLSYAFGKENVIRNIKLPEGADVKAALRKAVSGVDVMVVVIGPGWSEARKPDRLRSLADPADAVRLEIAAGLRSAMRVIPVLVGGAAFPPLDKFPQAIRDLTLSNAIELADDRWDQDVSLLTDAIAAIVPRGDRVDSRGPIVTDPPNLPSPLAENHASIIPNRAEVVDGATVDGRPLAITAADARDLFISHVEEDETTALALAEALRAQGPSTWMYEEDGVPGVSYLTQIDTAIAGCRGVVIIASAKAVAAHEVIREVEAAHQRAKMIIPIRIGLTHQQFTDANAILRIATGTAVSIAMREGDVANIAKRIVQALRVGAPQA